MDQHNGLAMSRQYRQEHDLNMIPVVFCSEISVICRCSVKTL